MGFRELLLPWDSQPQEAVEVDWSNPLTDGLILALLPFDDGNLVTGTRLTKIGGGPARSVTRAGLAHAFSSASYFEFAPPSGLTAGTAFCLTTETAPFYSVQPWRITSNESDFFPFTALSNQCFSNAWATSRWLSAVPIPAGTDKSLYSVCALGSIQANSHAAYISGQKIGTGNATFAVDATIRVGYSGFSDSNHSAALYFFWSRTLSDAEVAQVSANPWQLFRPHSIWVPVTAGGGGAPTLSLPAVFNIAATSAQPRVTVTF